MLFRSIPATAPTGRQLHDILWAELAFWLKRCALKDIFEYRRDKIFVKGFKEWYAVARTVPKDSKDLNDTLAGFHAPWLLILVDEASGVPDPVFTALDGAMTQKDSYILLISNPVSTGGYFYDTITDREGRGKDYYVMTFSALDSPLVDPSYEEHIITRYGKDSPMYRAKVLGEPIELRDSVVVPPDVFDEVVNKNRDITQGSVVLGVDVARGGDDLTVICHRRGNSIVDWTEFPTNDTLYLVDEIIRIWRSRYSDELFCVVVDAANIGAGVYDLLRQQRLFPVVGHVGSEKATQDKSYRNRRTEIYHRLSQSFKDLHFPVRPPDRLKKELANLRFELDGEQIEMEDKKKFKKRMGFSPDYADALSLTFAVDNFVMSYSQAFMRPKVVSLMAPLLVGERQERYGRFGRFL